MLERVESLWPEWQRLSGKFVAVDLENARFFVSNNTIEAVLKTKKAHQHCTFTIVRIGYEAANPTGAALKEIEMA